MAIEVDREAGGHAFEDRDERLSVRLAGGEKSQHQSFILSEKTAASWRVRAVVRAFSRVPLLAPHRRQTRMHLVADRFIVDDAAARDSTVGTTSLGSHLERGRDLASGDEVVLIVSTAGGPGEQLQWALRCGRYAHLHHPAIARLLDYGRLGETRRFEAWRAGGDWRGSRDAGVRARRACDLFLRSSDLSITGNPHVSFWRNAPVVIPDAGAGLEADAGRGETSVDDESGLWGLESVARPAVAAVGELLADPDPLEPRVIALWGVSGAGLRVAIREIARLARLNGMVPIDASVANPAVWSLVRGRTAMIIQTAVETTLTRDAAGWRRWLDAGMCLARSHVLLMVAAREVPRVQNLRLDPVSDEVLVRAVRPYARAVVHQSSLTRLAARARGCPGRFAASLRITPTVRACSTTVHPSRAAESPPLYKSASSPPRVRRWPVSGDVAALRNRLASAEHDLERGGHISASRAILGWVGALRRRGDHATAARGLLALARARLRRGYVAEARRALDEARASAHEAGDDDALLEIAVTCGHACIDSGTLCDGEVVLRGAVAAARGRNRPELFVEASLGLARGLFWQGRFEESWTLVVGLDRQSLSDVQRVAVAIAAARAASGCPTAQRSSVRVRSSRDGGRSRH